MISRLWHSISRGVSGTTAFKKRLRVGIGILIFVPLLTRAIPAVGETCATFGFPTTQDNTSLTVLSNGGSPVLLVPSGGTASDGQVNVISRENGVWTQAVLSLPPDTAANDIRGVPDSADRIVHKTASPLSLVFSQLTRSQSDGSWRIVEQATASPPDGTTGIYLSAVAPDENAALVSASPQGKVYLVRSGQAPVELGVATEILESVWTPQGILVLRHIGGAYSLSLNDAAAGTELQRIEITPDFVALTAEGAWVAESGVLKRIAPPALAPDVRVPIGPDQVNNVLGIPTGGFLAQTTAPDGSRFLLRYDKAGNELFRHPSAVQRIVTVSPDGNFAASAYELVDLGSGATITRNIFDSNQPSVGTAAIETPDGRTYLTRANYYSDSLVMTELHRDCLVWDQPIASLISYQPTVMEFAPGQRSAEIDLAMPFNDQLDLLTPAAAGAPPAFSTSTNAIAFPPGGGSGIVTVAYQAGAAGPPHLGFLHAESPVGPGRGGFYNVAVLFGGVEGAPGLTAEQKGELGRYAQAQTGYFLDAQSNNVILSWPCSWSSPTLPRDQGGYAITHEIGLKFISLISAAELGLVDPTVAWTLVERGLANLLALQRMPGQFPDGVYWRSYIIRNPDGSDRTLEQVTSAMAPSSDDNGLLAMSLMLTESIARDADRLIAAALCRRILAGMDLRRFLTADSSQIAHFRSPGGEYSAATWDRTGDEGPVIAAAALALGQITREEFVAVVGRMFAPAGHWRGRIFIPQADAMGAMFVRGVRPQAGVPVTSGEFPGVTYGIGTRALLSAHLDDMRERGDEMTFSHAMTQSVSGISQATGKGAGNEYGNILAEERQAMTAPHAAFIPLSRPGYLDREGIDALFAMLRAFAPLYFHDEPGRRGWEAAVPFRPEPYTGTDQGHAFEALNSAYVILSVFDALASSPLSARQPARDLLGHAFAWVDSGIPFPADFPRGFLPDLTAPDPPRAVADAANTEEDLPVSIAVLDNDLVGGCGGLSVSAVTQGVAGRTAVAGLDVTYTPNRDRTGFDTFTYTITDACGGTDTTAVTVTIAPRFDLSGKVHDGGNRPLAKVILTLTGGDEPRRIKTDKLGRYRFADLRPGIYTLKPAKSGWMFKPGKRIVTVMDADRTGRSFTGTRK